MKVRFLEPAHDEFLVAVDFYEERATRLGGAFVDEVEHALELLSDSPLLGAPFTADARRLLLRRFPYDIVYTVEQEVVVIVAVAHQRRKPGYWKDRR